MAVKFKEESDCVKESLVAVSARVFSEDVEDEVDEYEFSSLARAVFGS